MMDFKLRCCAAVVSLGFFALVSSPSHAQELGNPAAGLSIFQSCGGCHAIGEGAGNGMGPALNGVFCRSMGSAQNFPYSDAMQRKASEREHWTIAALNEYLQNPSAYLGGPSRMSLKLSKEKDRLDVIAFLSILNADGTLLAEGEAIPEC